MATLVRPGRPLSPRIQRAYRLEMAGRTVALLLLLLGLTGLVVFYLGVITGKGLRDPNQPTLADANALAPAATDAKPAASPGVQPTALNHALQAPNGQIEGLKKEGDSANQQTQQLLSRAKQELVLDEVRDKGTPPVASNLAPAPITAANSAAKTAAQPAPKTPAKPAAPAQTATQKKPAAARAPAPPAAPAAAESDGVFTVQVFSSPQQQHAQDILADLKKKGFPAYMNQFQAADKRTWYRVRVGKSTRAEADALAVKIRGSTTNLDPRVMKQ